MKKRKYNIENVELCRNCSGRGIVSYSDFLGYALHFQHCTICKGSGRIVRVKEVKETIRPFNEVIDKKIK